jgi:hypothetical protein
MKRKITKEEFAIAKANGICRSTVSTRVHQNDWDYERAITTPTNPHGVKFSRKGWQEIREKKRGARV